MESDIKHPAKTEQVESELKPYESPELTIYGKVETETGGSGPV